MIESKAIELNKMWIKFKWRKIADISLYNYPLNNLYWFMHPKSFNESIGTYKKETSFPGFSIPLMESETINIITIINSIKKVNEISFILGQKANLNMERKVSYFGS